MKIDEDWSSFKDIRFLSGDEFLPFFWTGPVIPLTFPDVNNLNPEKT